MCNDVIFAKGLYRGAELGDFNRFLFTNYKFIIASLQIVINQPQVFGN